MPAAGVPHFYLPIRGSPAPADLTTKLADLLAKDPHSWKPVPIIHSLGLSTSFQWQSATDSMDEWLTIADGSGRNTPFLWLGPNAAGHLKPPGKILQEGNNALWHYTVEMGKEAVRRGVDNLGLYNMTLQAQSFDGSGYGERVMVTQAMMVSSTYLSCPLFVLWTLIARTCYCDGPTANEVCLNRLPIGSPNWRRPEHPCFTTHAGKGRRNYCCIDICRIGACWIGLGIGGLFTATERTCEYLEQWMDGHVFVCQVLSLLVCTCISIYFE